MDNLSTLLVRTGLDVKLPDFFPQGKRSEEALLKHFESVGLKPVAEFYRKRQVTAVKITVKMQVLELIQSGKSQSEVIF
jgi:hypothetical protein